MISFEQYKALVYISDHPGTTKASCSGKITEDVLDSLLDDDLIQWDESAVQWIDTNSPINPIGLERDYQNAILFVTPAGHAAMEEYEAAQRSEQREVESLRVANRANNIAIGAAIAAGVALFFQAAEWITGIIQQFAG